MNVFCYEDFEKRPHNFKEFYIINEDWINFQLKPDNKECYFFNSVPEKKYRETHSRHH